jgi:ATPase subunit of ABC transporter with duplicated ATPase domains
MDEPTNHMDLPSIQCLEDALSDCPCALLLVSHDMQFLRGLTTKRWDIAPHSDREGAHESGIPEATVAGAQRQQFELREIGWN